MRLIDAEALNSELIERQYSEQTMGILYSIYPQMMAIVSKQPTIEAEPVKHGRWIERTTTKGQVFCSECLTIQKVSDSNYRTRRCPNCGAKMDKAYRDSHRAFKGDKLL